MGCFIPHKRQAFPVWPAPAPVPGLVASCLADWTCRFVLCDDHDKTTTIIDTDTYNCVKITSGGYGQRIADIWFDGITLFCAGETCYNWSGAWQAQLLKFDTNLNLLLRKVFRSTDYSVVFTRIIKSGSSIYISGNWFFPENGVIYKFSEDFTKQSIYAWGSDSLCLG